MCSYKFHKIHKKTSDNEAFFKKIVGSSPASLIRKHSIADVFMESQKISMTV